MPRIRTTSFHSAARDKSLSSEFLRILFRLQLPCITRLHFQKAM